MITRLFNRKSKILIGEDFLPLGFESVTYVNAEGKLIYLTNIQLSTGHMLMGEVIAVSEWDDLTKKSKAIKLDKIVLDYTILLNQ